MKYDVKMATFTLILAGLFVQGCSKDAKESQTLTEIYAEQGLPVKVETLDKNPFAVFYSASAVLTGIQESTAHAMVADQVDDILRQVGDAIQKDDIIITFPTNNPSAKYMQAKVNVEHMRTTLERMKSLYESGGISRQELDNVAAQCEVAEANWDAAQQTVLVRAPIAGILTRIDVQKSDNVNPGDPLFTVAQTKQLKTQLWVSENQISEIHKGDKATALWNNLEIEGQVSQVDLSLNSRMQAFGVQVEFDNSQQTMRAGINAEIQIHSTQNQTFVIVARRNLVKFGNEYIVYKLAGDRAVKQPVVLGRQIGLDVEIRQGLNEGDTIITEGASLVEDGQRVRVVNE